MKIYVSGPMTSLPDLNFPAFNQAAAELRALGHQVSNPAEKGELPGWSWEDYLAYDLIEVCRLIEQPKEGFERSVGAIITLPGWEDSAGARLEVQTANALKIPVISYSLFMLTQSVAAAFV